MKESKNILKVKSFDFAKRVIKLYKFLTENKNEYILSKQLLRSGTSVGALVREAQNAESNKDFIHKLSIAQKECDESLYWLELMHASAFLTKQEFSSIYAEAGEILKIIKSTILTMKSKILNTSITHHS